MSNFMDEHGRVLKEAEDELRLLIKERQKLQDAVRKESENARNGIVTVRANGFRQRLKFAWTMLRDGKVEIRKVQK